mmetsp:Transcript_11518/g.22737  ORF Transcript_11518/g.22737 Transcript_11518/m.22737 type:complete len:304 (+) Transcript_11518:459-1370(+)
MTMPYGPNVWVDGRTVEAGRRELLTCRRLRRVRGVQGPPHESRGGSLRNVPLSRVWEIIVANSVNDQHASLFIGVSIDNVLWHIARSLKHLTLALLVARKHCDLGLSLPVHLHNLPNRLASRSIRNPVDLERGLHEHIVSASEAKVVEPPELRSHLLSLRHLLPVLIPLDKICSRQVAWPHERLGAQPHHPLLRRIVLRNSQRASLRQGVADARRTNRVQACWIKLIRQKAIVHGQQPPAGEEDSRVCRRLDVINLVQPRSLPKHSALACAALEHVRALIPELHCFLLLQVPFSPDKPVPRLA